MKRLTLGLLSACFFGLCGPVSAQTADTTSAWRYLALDVGNVWEYERWEDVCAPEPPWPPFCEPEPAGFLRRRVTGEAVRGDTTFMIVEDAFFSVSGQPTGANEVLVRFDTTESRAYEHRLDGALRYGWPEGFPCPLDMPFGGDGDECEGYALADPYEAEIFGEQVLGKYVATLGSAYLFVADLGLVSVTLGKFITEGYDLTYARIDGVEYGVKQFPVASESTPVLSSFALASYPNPTRDAATLTLTLDRPQRATVAVYNVLGRQVLSADLGALPTGEAIHRLDLAALRPGVYVVRLQGDRGARATTRLVVQ